MIYNSAQTDKLRRGLNRYREITAADGRLPSWQSVCDQIQSCKEINQPDPPISPEILRRFTTMASIPMAEAMDAIHRFLVQKNMLDAKDF